MLDWFLNNSICLEESEGTKDTSHKSEDGSLVGGDSSAVNNWLGLSGGSGRDGDLGLCDNLGLRKLDSGGLRSDGLVDGATTDGVDDLGVLGNDDALAHGLDDGLVGGDGGGNLLDNDRGGGVDVGHNLALNSLGDSHGVNLVLGLVDDVGLVLGDIGLLNLVVDGAVDLDDLVVGGGVDIGDDLAGNSLGDSDGVNVGLGLVDNVGLILGNVGLLDMLVVGGLNNLLDDTGGGVCLSDDLTSDGLGNSDGADSGASGVNNVCLVLGDIGLLDVLIVGRLDDLLDHAGGSVGLGDNLASNGLGDGNRADGGSGLVDNIGLVLGHIRLLDVLVVGGLDNIVDVASGCVNLSDDLSSNGLGPGHRAQRSAGDIFDISVVLGNIRLLDCHINGLGLSDDKCRGCELSLVVGAVSC